MKKYIITFCGVLIATFAINAVEVNHGGFPDVQIHDDGIAAYGSLENAAATLVDFTSWTTPDYFEFSRSWTGHFEDCCVGEQSGKKYIIPNEKLKMTWTKPTSIIISMATWNLRTDTCESATNEWNRYRSEVIAHENEHVNVFTNWHSQGHIESYFANVSAESGCELFPELAKASADEQMATLYDITAESFASGHITQQGMVDVNTTVVGLRTRFKCN